jgi:hypothetical protein
MTPQHEIDCHRSRLLEAEFDRVCEQFAFAKDAEHRRMALEQVHDLMAEMDDGIRAVIDPGMRPS